MPIDSGFVAAVLSGIEGTLGELIELSDDSPETRAGLDALQDKVVALRTSLGEEIEDPQQEEEEPVGAG